ncbi:uncharacterized protein [Clinocottus analis]|uniref:uncharacterized protein isoform X2 n=1 Tax=Clinocottus analis TaxID=304258 RepID=UPI0035BEC1E0
MDSVDTATSEGDNMRRGNKRTRDWYKRLHLRKTAVQPPTMQSADKRGTKKIVGEWEQSTLWPSSQKPPKEAQRGQHTANGDSGTGDNNNTLKFACAQCRDNLEYVPKDLVKHFEKNHRGSPPVFACHTCTFTTHEFSYLQVHRLSHRDTFSSCSVCHDDVVRTWPELSAHLAACHCQSGKYLCAMCPKFSTGKVGVFLEHTYAHNLGLEEAKSLLPHTTGKNMLGPKTSARVLCCQQCGYKASQKWLIAKHVKAVHVCQNGNQRKKEDEGICSLAIKPNDLIPKVKPRLTRSAVREMCWLTQDCLSLPGREFLDKYCHLSDPQTTLEETQQFLMKSVAGKTGDQKWTKALKTVLSNVPQDMNTNPKAENVIAANSPDLTVLTVKNKITVAQNGATYAKRLKVMTLSDKETVALESAPGDARCVVGQNGCKSNSSECTQTESKQKKDVSLPSQSEPSECTRMQENSESLELKGDQEMEVHGKKPEAPAHKGGTGISSELKLTNESGEQTPVHKVAPKSKRRRWKRPARSKRAGKRSSGLALKIVLKKVKEKQWLSQSSLSPSGSGPAGDSPGLPCPHTALEEAAQILKDLPPMEVYQEEWTKASYADRNDSEAVTPSPRSKPGEGLTPGRAAKLPGPRSLDGSAAATLQGSASSPPVAHGVAGESPECPGAAVDESRLAQETGQSGLMTELGACPEDARRPTSGSSTDRRESDDGMISAADEVTPHSGSTKSSPVSISIITAQERNADDSGPDVLGNIQQGPSPPSGYQWHPLPKHLERTLKLVAINPSQPVKRPAGDQPVVVLNHPDACIPEVARIMEVINRYRGEVQKVVLSQRTASVLSATCVKASDPADSAARAKSAVQERFLLKLKLRRLSRKKYEVVDVASPAREEEAATAAMFRCWFCGRLFACREKWTAHRQQHLMEWRKPNCENS